MRWLIVILLFVSFLGQRCDKWGARSPLFLYFFVVNLIVTKPHKKVAQGFQLFYGRVGFQFCIIAPLRSLFRCALSLAHRRTDRGSC